MPSSSTVTHINTTSPNSPVIGVSGAVTANTSTLFLADDANSTAAITIRNGSTLTSDYVRFSEGTNNTNSSGTVTGSGTTWNIEGSYGLIVGNYGTGTLTISNSATVAVTEYTIIGRAATGTVNIQSGAQMTTGSYARIGGEGGSDENGQGTVTVDGNGSQWTIDGVLNIGYSGGSGSSGTLNIQNRGTVVAANDTIIGARSGADGTLSISSGGILETTSLQQNGGSAQVNFASGILRAAADNTDFISGFTGTELNLASGGLTIDTNGHDVTVMSPLTGSGGLGLTGGGTLTLVGTNTYSGGTTIAAGTLSVSSDDNLGASGVSLVFNGGTLHNSSTIVSSRGVALQAGGGTLQTDNDLTLGGAITGGGDLTKTGSGTLVLSGNNSFSGTTTISDGTLQVGDGGTAGTLGTGSVVNNSALLFNRSNDLTYGGTISGSGAVTKAGAGTLIITGSNTYSGTTTISDGTLQLGNGGTSGTLGTAGVANNSTLAVNRSDDLNYGGVISGSGTVIQQGTNTLTLSGNNSYSGGTVMNAGTLAVSADTHLGDASGGLTFDGATLQTTAAFTSARAVTLNAGGGTVQTDNDLTLGGVIAGAGALTKTGSGTLTLSGNNTFSGGTVMNAGTLSAGADANLGDTSGGLTFDGGTLQNSAAFSSSRGVTLGAGGGTFQTDNNLTLGGVITGAGALTKTGTGTLILTGSNTYSGTATISAGTLQVGNGGTSGSLGTGGLTNNGTLSFNRSDDLSYAGVIGGTGTVTKQGGGALTLSGANTYTGATTVAAGTLIVDGDQSAATGATTVQSGATVQGNGTIGGDVTVGAGATLASQSTVGGNSKLTIKGDLNLDSSSSLNYSYGISPNNDHDALMVQVEGDLDLNGTLNVENTSGTNLDPGVFGLIHYDGALSGAGLTIGAMPPAGDFEVQTSVDNRVNLVNTAGLNMDFWDGNGTQNDGTITGGSGTWQGSGGTDNWTTDDGNVNSAFASSGFAIFQVTGGTVTVDDSNGAVSVTGMQFAVDGYTIAGDAVTLGSDPVTIVVGDRTQTGAAYTATINSVLQGAAQLVKDDLGTLVLGGTNTYNGGTAIDAGTLQISRDENLGATAGALTFDSGTLQNTAAFSSARGITLNTGGGTFQTDDDLTLSGQIGGAGMLTKTGTGTLTLSGNNAYSGGTSIEAGTLSVSSDTNLGDASGGLTFDGGTLQNTAAFTSARGVTLNAGGGTFQADNKLTLGGIVTGAGALTKTGTGTLVLAADNTYSGATTISGGTLQIGDGGTSGSLGTGDLTNNAALVFNRSDDVSYAGVIGGSGTVTQQGGGTLTLTGNNTYGGITTISGGILQVGDGGTSGSLGAGDVTNNAALAFDRSDDVSYAGVISGSGTVTQQGSGTLTLSGANTYGGGTVLKAGTLSVADDAHLGAASGGLTFDGGTLQNTAALSSSRGVTLDAGGGTFQTDDDLTLQGTITGTGGFEKTGSGTLVLTADNGYSGGTTISDGTVQVGNGGTSGSLGTGDVVNDGALVFNRSNDMTYGGAISGTGTMTKQGGNTLILTGDSTFGGVTTVSGGTLQVGDGGTSGSLGTGDLVNGGALVFNRSDDSSYGGVISGTGTLTKNGAGVLTLSGDNTYTAATTVAAGTLVVDGDQSAATGETTVQSGATLRGSGTIGGDIVVNTGGAVTSMDDNADGISKLTVNGDLNLGSGVSALSSHSASSGTSLNFDYGLSPNGDPDALMVHVAGDLDLNGTLNISNSSGEDFDPGLFGLIHYEGALSGGGLTLGTTPVDGLVLQTVVPGRINFVNTSSLSLNFWDGTGTPDNGVINGGPGTWQAASGSQLWTNSDGTIDVGYTDNSFAIFMSTGGAVAVDASLGEVRATGMQFAADGYSITGDSITLTEDRSIIRVGDNTPAGAEFTATIESKLTGDVQLVKADLGTLVLTADNSYTGGTEIDGGTLSISRDANLGAAGTAITFNGGALQNTASFESGRDVTVGEHGGAFLTDADLTWSGVLSGEGALTKAGDSTLVLTADNTYAGGTTVLAGVLQVGDGGTSGSIDGDVTTHGTLAFNRSDAYGFSGNISGQGAIAQIGSGTTELTGQSSHAGPTTVTAGVLKAGAAGAFSPASAHSVHSGATLDLAGYDQAVAALENAGTVQLGDTPGTTLTVSGNHVGRGGTIHLGTALAGDDSVTDRLHVQGDTAGATTLAVNNVDGQGAQTTAGVKLVDVDGVSNGGFALQGDYVFKGDPAVVAGAYAYRLYKGTPDSDDGDWYLRSQLEQEPKPPKPPKPQPHYQPGTPVYESYAQVLTLLNEVDTMRQRTGQRQWLQPEGANTGGKDMDSAAMDNGVWGRIGARHGSYNPRAATSDMDYDSTLWTMQAGIDARLMESGAGRLIGGVSGHYATADTDAHSPHGDGGIDTEGYGVGATLTWLAESGLYADAQGQATWSESDFYSLTAHRTLARDSKGFGYAGSFEAGWQMPVAPAWSLTPQAQVTYSDVSFDRFTDSFGAQIDDDKGESLKARAGLAADYQDSWTDARGQAASADLYGIANVYYETMDGMTVDVAGTPFTTANHRLWTGIGLGGTYDWADGRYAVHADIATNTAVDDFAKNYAISANVGVRIRW